MGSFHQSTWPRRNHTYSRGGGSNLKLEGRNSHVSQTFWGVRMRSVMDSLLTELQRADVGVSINGIYTGSLGHADDLRSITPNLASIQKQANIVKSFTESNGLKLNTGKLELLAMSDGNSPSNCEVPIGATSVVSSNTAKCLGVTWTHNLSPKVSIELNIQKARRAYFALGSLGIRHGKQNPLNASEIFEVCVLPACLYGCLLTEPLLQMRRASRKKWAKKFSASPNITPTSAL